ncbi:helix-turn-helix transcriptional regulator [Leptospira sp. 201903070]|uniref:Helix-turn-helix transcriptional regulator n=1 Tax=Leptospira ainlahdjerensis TaxID=2810033 RepID=A0ABS2UCX2_9LEPT|nr:helix-turn-helix transcriptional regulator [Leptospira ainlahdjerensis]MBM9578221.1 helix-turn-helix transcriptional regulator [Leptospira ainlahdjerensis]
MSESDKINELISKRFSEFFKTVGLTQEEFAKRIRVARSNISSWKNGTHGISGSALKAMEHEFKLNSLWLLSGEGKMFLSEKEISNEEQAKLAWKAVIKSQRNPKLRKLLDLLNDTTLADDQIEALEKIIRSMKN